MLRQFTDASKQPEFESPTWTPLWLYIPDFMKGGAMNNIHFVPKAGITYAEVNQAFKKEGKLPSEMVYWQENDACAGFEVGPNCHLRYDEMQLVTYSPVQCQGQDVRGCEFLISYARVDMSYTIKQEAMWNFYTTLFTIFFLSGIFIIFNRDTENVVVKPIKKVV